MKKISIFFVSCLILNIPQLSAQLKVTRVVGEVKARDDATMEWQTVSRGQNISAGAQIKTSRRSSVEGVTIQNHKIKIDENSIVAVDEASKNANVFSMMVGKIRSWVKRLRPIDKYHVRTPVSVISVRGTDFSVSVDEANKVRVEVYEGIVAAREEMTGIEIEIPEGHSTTIIENTPPSAPEKLDIEKTEIPETERIKSVVQAEMFDEISKDAVLSRAAAEIKLAEFQNGKAIIDVHGKRVRLEEYVVRPAENQFKYVVLNTRENRFDFGKLLFTFNSALPRDLTEATKNMFYYDGVTKPSNWLTGVDSVMSNTVDKVNEVATGGNMYADNPANPKSWYLMFNEFKFLVNDKKWWDFTDSNQNGRLDSGELLYYNIATGLPLNFRTDFQYDSKLGKYYFLDGERKVYFNEFSQPGGPEVFHFYQRNNYSKNQWIAASDYIADDDGKIITIADLKNKKPEELRDYAYKLNLQRTYTSSAFTNQNAKNDKGEITIDLVFSSKLLVDSGILSLPNPQNYTAPAY